MTLPLVRRAGRGRAATLALLLASCVSSTSSVTTSTTVPQGNPETITFASSLGVNLAAMTKSATGLYTQDITVGTGATLAAGQKATVAYTGWLPDGSQFDASTGAQFTIGTGVLIAGWDQGIPGMKVGGKRRLVIPPALGYGASGSLPKIPGNVSLVFDVTLVSVP